MNQPAVKSRLFIALWPDSGVREQLSNLGDSIPQISRPVPAGNLHMTLRFVGAVTPHQHATLIATINEFYWRSFHLILDRIGYWPKQQLLFAAPRQRNDALNQLHARLNSALATKGFLTCRREFKPHITLARRVRNRPRRPAPSIHWQCRQLVLMQSTQTPSGSHYDELAHATVESVGDDVISDHQSTLC